MRSNARAIRRIFRLLLCAPWLLVSFGCEVDDTVRGAGSIEVPREALKYQTPEKATGTKAKSHRVR